MFDVFVVNIDVDVAVAVVMYQRRVAVAVGLLDLSGGEWEERLGKTSTTFIVARFVRHWLGSFPTLVVVLVGPSLPVFVIVFSVSIRRCGV
jgi:hypothetical protein